MTDSYRALWVAVMADRHVLHTQLCKIDNGGSVSQPPCLPCYTKVHKLRITHKGGIGFTASNVERRTAFFTFHVTLLADTLLHNLHWYNACGRQFSIFCHQSNKFPDSGKASKVHLKIDEVTGLLSLLGHGCKGKGET